MSYGQTAIPGVYLRGGTSKALFFHAKDLPGPGALRDNILQRLMGSPDPRQIDGMGGARVTTTKTAIIAPSTRPGIDVDYTFGQVGISEGGVHYGGNCGNISSGVAPFAVDEGLLDGREWRVGKSVAGEEEEEGVKVREVRIWQTGTEKLLISHVPVNAKTGKSVSKGGFEISGVPGTGAPILMDFRNTIGACLSKGAIPTGNVVDTVTIGSTPVEFTLCDVANPCIFVLASAIGATGYEAPDDITSNAALIARCKELRGKAAQLAGMCTEWEKVDEQSFGLPMVVMIGPPPPPEYYVNGSGPGSGEQAHLTARLLLNGMCHDTMAGTGAMCTAACSRILGTVVQKIVGDKGVKENVLKIGHAVGIMPAFVEAGREGKDGMLVQGSERFELLAFVRTSRRLMKGEFYVPEEVWDGKEGLAGAANGVKTNGVRH